MDGMNWDKLPGEVKEDLIMNQSSMAGEEAEKMWVTQNYQPLIDLYNAVEESNRAVLGMNMTMLQEMEEENFGDC